MKTISLKKAAEFSGGKVNTSNTANIDSVIIDSRDAAPGTLFFCIKGANNDGHDYISQARDAGAICIGEKPECDILVKSSVAALGNLAREYRKTLDIVVVGVSGSSGKTTTCNMLYKILSVKYKVHCSKKSFNNNIGLPLSILSIDPDVQIAVLEMGANHVAEIAELCQIADPSIGVLTNIGDAHLGYFGTKEAILNTKMELVEYLPKGGTIVYNADQQELTKAIVEYGDHLNLNGFSLENTSNFHAQLLLSESERSIFDIEGYRFDLPVPGIFNVYNALAAISTAKIFDMEFSEMYEALKEFKNLEHRMKFLRADNINILDDSYNSNPSSVKILFAELLKIYPQNNIIAVIGDMLELGEDAEDLHFEVGSEIASKSNVKYILSGGDYSHNLIAGALENGFPREQIIEFKDAKSAADTIRVLADDNSIVVLKASRLQHLEEVAEQLINK